MKKATRAHRLQGVVVAAALTVAGCGSIGKSVDRLEQQLGLAQAAGTYPKNSTLIPDVRIGLSPNSTLTLEQVAYSATGLALLYYIYDPLAPNWSIEEAALAEDTYRLSLKLKRFHTGGDGEAILVLRRRAAQLKQEKGFADFQIVDYAEGIESSTPIAQRYGEGVIRLVSRLPAPPAVRPASGRVPAAAAEAKP